MEMARVSVASNSSLIPFRARKWFKKVTRAEKVLCASLVTTFCLCLMFISCSVLLWHSNRQFAWLAKRTYYNGQPTDSCLSHACVEAAARIMQQINESVNPCDDFYSFACGGLDNPANVIPDDSSNIGTASVLQADIDKKLRVLLENIQERNESHFLGKMNILYTKCMNKTAHESLADDPLRYVLEEIGGWPVVEGNSWNSTNFTLSDALVQMKRMGYKHDTFLALEVAPHVLAHQYNVIYLGLGDLGLDDRSYYLDPIYKDTLEAYHEFMVEAASELGAAPNEARTEMKKVLDFETKLAQLLLPRDVKSNILNYMNLSMIEELAPVLNWTKYLNGVFYPYIYVSDNALLIVKNPPYLRNVSLLIAETEDRVLSNYLAWKIVMESTSILSDKWARMARKLWVKLDGRPKLRNKWTFCVSTVKKYFGIGTSALYVSSINEEARVPVVLEIVNYIKNAFMNILRSTSWMDMVTVEEAINKTESMKIHVGYPTELVNETAVNDNYEFARIKWGWSFFTNILMLRRFRMDYKYVKVQDENIKGHWLEYGKVADVNAYYRSQENSIEFPMSLIEAMDIEKSNPMYLNFGNIGWVIGHEITHGFDNMGRHFDGEGEYRSWWTNETDAQYEAKAKCFVKQYSNYSLPHSTQKVNGKITLGENIADNGGLKEAFQAYKQYVSDKGKERALPGLRYSPEQLFFIQSASFYCAKFRPEIREYALKTDSHSPNPFRIKGSMSNLKEFSETFNCPKGSPMNPVEKCSLW